MKHLLIVDDERGSRESLRAIFQKDYELSLADSAEKASGLLADRSVDLILLDVVMPKKDGVAFLREVQAAHPDVPVVMVSASTSVRPVVESIQVGACDYVTKPFDVKEIRRIVKRAIEAATLRKRVRTLETEVAREFPVEGIVGDSPPFRRALEDARKAAATDATVLICGESGTGKELVARLIHTQSSRREEPFVPVHCAALPESLMESELFGHEKGAFTGADRQRPGRFDLAGSGTLFFDEVSEMSTATQVKLLRVLQEREFMRVGGSRVIRTDARILAASAKDLRAEVANQAFRDDLFYRLSVVPISLPPLRERSGDLPLLCRYFLDYFRQSMDVATEDFEPAAMDLICGYSWPGNVRELRNIVERMLVLHRQERTVRPEFLPGEFHRGADPAPPPRAAAGATLEEAVSAYEREIILNALREAGGVQTRAARLLGTTRRILRYRMQKLEIESGRAAGAG